MSALDNATVCRVLQPLFDLGDFRDLNGPSGHRLANMILPRTAADLTVRELLDMLALLGKPA